MTACRASLLAAVLGFLAGCTQTSSSSSGAGPKGAAHGPHLRGGVYSAGGTCADCHASSGFAVDFSQNPMMAAGGASYDAATKTCSNVYCHGSFGYGGVSGTNARPVWSDATPVTCASCHAMPPAGHPSIGAAADAKSCHACHADSVSLDGTINVASGAHLNGKAEAASGSCAACHGDASRVGILPGTDFYLTSAPPVAPANAPPYAVGAHQGHMNPASSTAVASPVACAECHVVPPDSAHATNPPAQKVVFGALASAGGATPSWSATTTGCAATWCHGNFTLAGVSGANATPTWTDTAAVTCTSCHGMPPTGHPPLSGTVTAATCNGCHPQSVDAQGRIVVSSGTHMDGKAQSAALGCTACHGDATRTPLLPGADPNLASAPPVAPTGAPAYAVGAHLGHMNPSAASYLMAPIACAECHVVPADSAHAANPPTEKVVFGTLSRTGGATPSWSATTTGCAATYCHGNFTFGTVTGTNATPTWTTTTALACTSCHAMPPTGHPAYTGTPTAASCSPCHPQSVNTDGTIKQGGGHINGKADGGDCKSCHGDPPTTGGHGRHSNYGCGECHPTGYSSTTAVAPFHQNGVVDLGSQAHYFCNGAPSLVGCTPLPPPPTQPSGPYGTCTLNCHNQQHTNERWIPGN
jgi:predicted CxxxxCH...CXXCH cytochrome family protein